MGRIDNLNQGNLADLERRIRALETATPMNNAAIGRSGMEIYNGGTLLISNGGLVVNGSATIVGTLNADGTINMTGLFIASGEMRLNGTTIATGDFNIDGPLIVDGNTTFNGTLNITGVTTITGDATVTGRLTTNGPVDINGLTTLTGNLNVTGGGKITIGGMVLDPAALGGKLGFSNGSYVAATPNGAQIAQGTSAAYVSASQAGIAKGGVGVLVDATSPVMTGVPITSQPGNLYLDPATNRIYRSTA